MAQMNMNVANANFNSNLERGANNHMGHQTNHQNVPSGRVASNNGNSGRRSIKSLNRNMNAN